MEDCLNHIEKKFIKELGLSNNYYENINNLPESINIDTELSLLRKIDSEKEKIKSENTTKDIYIFFIFYKCLSLLISKHRKIIYNTRMKTYLFLILTYVANSILDRTYYDALELPVSASPDEIR